MLPASARSALLRSILPGSARVVWRARAELRQIALTFDDGPDPEGTPAVLDALGGTPATFFLLAERAIRAPELVARIVAEGHEVALHADRHERLDRVPVRELTARLHGARATLEDLAGRSVKSHRPPFGHVSWRALRAARRAALQVVLWSCNPGDFEERPIHETSARILSCVKPGAIVLLHDGGDTFPSQGRATADALSDALRAVGDLELAAVRVSEL